MVSKVSFLGKSFHKRSGIDKVISFDKSFGSMVVGTDEAGRGALAGPIFAAAVSLNSYEPWVMLDDSKKMKPADRFFLRDALLENANVGVGNANVEEINKLNPLQASLLAMNRACKNIDCVPSKILIDGPFAFDFPCEVIPVIKGDTKSLLIAAASIVAKACRDDFMISIHEIFPEYRWDKNKGYGSAEHISAIQRLGPCSMHRPNFQPIKKFFTTKF